jgi:flagellar capping protein FliD
MSSTDSTASSANLQTSSIYRLNGTNLYSGLDTDSIIKALVSNTQSRIDKQQQLEQIAEWKRDLYRDVISDMQDFENTYFSYTSDTNLLSSTFFKTSTIKSSSSVVSATGNVDNAENLIINSISQIAAKASYSSTQPVSDKAITGGKIYSDWTQSALGGNSLVVSYNGTDYTLTMSHSVKLDSENSTITTENGQEVKKVADSELQKIVDGLNDQVDQNSSLKDKVCFSLDGNHEIVLTATDKKATNVGIKAYTTNSDTTTGKNFLAALGLSETTQSADGDGHIVLTGTKALDANVNTSALFNHTIASSSYLKFTLGSDTYTVKMGANLTINGATNGGYAQVIADQLQKQINADSELNGKITVSADPGTGKITFNSTGGDNLSVSGGSQNLLQGLGITPSESPNGTSVQSSGISAPALFKSYFGDTLAGNTLTFNLDGISKTITLNASDEAEYSSVGDSGSGLIHYLQSKLTDLFGTDSTTGKSKVQISATKDGGIQFIANDKTSVLSITSSDSSNVLNQIGALRISSGESNRAETSKTLSELASQKQLSQTLEAGSGNKYTISINGKELSFDGDTTLASVISQINSDTDMGVTVSYSQTTDSFRISADDSGAQGKINFQDLSGNFASTLFGISSMDFTGIHSGDISADANGSVTVSEDNNYTFSLTQSGQTVQKTITLSGGTYDSLTDLQNSLQEKINGQFGDGNVNVAVKGGKLVFDSSDGSALTAAFTSGSSNPLGISSDSNLSSSTLSALYADNTDHTVTGKNGTILTINQTGDGYTIGSDSTVYDGTATLYDAISGYTAGKDLKMEVSVNGNKQTIVRSSNTTSLDGVSLTVTGTTSDAVSFNVENNVDDLASKVVDFINAYNKIVDKVNTLTTESQERNNDHKIKYQPLTDAQKKDMTDDEIDKWNTEAKKGLLQNDNTLNGILDDLREAMTDKVESAGLSLSQLGISTQAYDYSSQAYDYTSGGGQLTVKIDTLKEKLQSDPDAVKSLFTDEDGVSQRVKSALDKYVGTFGGDGALLQLAGKDSRANDTSQLTTQIKRYQSTISDLKGQLQTEENRYWSKFTAMEQALSKLTAQSDYLASMFSNSSSS